MLAVTDSPSKLEGVAEGRGRMTTAGFMLPKLKLIMYYRRIKQVLEYGWKDSEILSKEDCTTRGRWSIFCDILRCFFKYNVWSNQYKKEKLHLLTDERKKEICLKYQEKNNKRDKWVKDFFDTYRFLNKWSKIKYETSASLQKKRNRAYNKHYNLDNDVIFEYGVILQRHHYVEGTFFTGKGCKILADVNIDYTGNILLEDHVAISEGVKILTHNHDINNHRRILTPLTIHDGVWIGSRAVIMPGVKEIGRRSIIAADSYVKSKVPPYAVVQGNPSKVVGFVLSVDQVLAFERDNYPEEERIPREDLEKIRNTFLTNLDFKDYSLHNTTNGDERVRDIVSECLGHRIDENEDEISMDEIDGWDSLANMTILSRLESELHVQFTQDEIFEMTTLRNIERIVKSKCFNKPYIDYKDLHLLYPHSSLWKAIVKRVEESPEKIAIKWANKRKQITYSELYLGVCKAADFLVKYGVKHGDSVILSAEKKEKFFFFYFAAHIIGSVNVIVDPKSNKDKLNFIIAATKPKLVIGFDIDNIETITYSEVRLDSCDVLQTVSYKSILSEDDVAEILFTTGTTGTPKGCCLSFNNIFNSANNINTYIGNSYDDIELIALPICHSFGMGRIRCSLMTGSTIVMLDSYANVQKFMDVVDKERITGFGIVPAAWSYIKKVGGDRIAAKSKNIKYIEIGSASMPIIDKCALIEIFPNAKICMHYGLTEASRSTFIEFHDSQHLSSIGKPVTNNVIIKIFNDEGKEVSKGKKGEICVAGGMVLKKYLNEKDNKEAFWGDFFRTGDCGYIDSDGYIYLEGREKELINVGGKKVSPFEVEDVIESLGVGDCVCVPVPDPQGILGEVVKCYILRDSTTLTFEEIDKKLTPLLEAYKKPSVYEWIDKIPHTESGKKQRMNLAEAF